MTVRLIPTNGIQNLCLVLVLIGGVISCSKKADSTSNVNPTATPTAILQSTPIPTPVATPNIVKISTPVPTPPPPPPETRRLAPPGVLYVIQYASVRTASGVVGFVPGARVRLVKDKGDTITVSDGTLKADVPVDNLTNDLDLAALAARRDAQSQDMLTKFLTGQQALAQAQRDQQGEAYDRDLRDAAARKAADAAAARESSALNKGAYNEKYSLPYWYRRGHIWYHH
jgi:hypothetical protein